jgi:hypothetical protein
MNILTGTIAWLSRCSGRQLLWRSLLAAPFTLSLVLALVLGPATITSAHGSFTRLAVLSLVAALLMLGLTERLPQLLLTRSHNSACREYLRRRAYHHERETRPLSYRRTASGAP